MRVYISFLRTLEGRWIKIEYVVCDAALKSIFLSQLIRPAIMFHLSSTIQNTNIPCHYNLKQKENLFRIHIKVLQILAKNRRKKTYISTYRYKRCLIPYRIHTPQLSLINLLIFFAAIDISLYMPLEKKNTTAKGSPLRLWEQKKNTHNSEK